MVVGLTGGIGSGKTTVANLFNKIANIAIYLADKEAKELMTKSTIIKAQLITRFGTECYINNQLNRAYIASLVFSNPEKLKQLNAIVHPEVNKHFKAFVAANRHKDYILYENAILFENQSDAFCDIIISVIADKQTRIERVVKRDNATRKEVLERIDNQWKDIKKALLSNYIILNSNNAKLETQIEEIHKKLTKKKG